jgi:hypothetical protein
LFFLFFARLEFADCGSEKGKEPGGEGVLGPNQIQLALGLKDFSNLARLKIQTFPPVEAAVSAATNLDFAGDPPSSGFGVPGTPAGTVRIPQATRLPLQQARLPFGTPVLVLAR